MRIILILSLLLSTLLAAVGQTNIEITIEDHISIVHQFIGLDQDGYLNFIGIRVDASDHSDLVQMVVSEEGEIQSIIDLSPNDESYGYTNKISGTDHLFVTTSTHNDSSSIYLLEFNADLSVKSIEKLINYQSQFAFLAGVMDDEGHVYISAVEFTGNLIPHLLKTNKERNAIIAENSDRHFTSFYFDIEVIDTTVIVYASDYFLTFNQSLDFITSKTESTQLMTQGGSIKIDDEILAIGNHRRIRETPPVDSDVCALLNYNLDTGVGDYTFQDDTTSLGIPAQFGGLVVYNDDTNVAYLDIMLKGLPRRPARDSFITRILDRDLNELCNFSFKNEEEVGYNIIDMSVLDDDRLVYYGAQFNSDSDINGVFFITPNHCDSLVSTSAPMYPSIKFNPNPASDQISFNHTNIFIDHTLEIKSMSGQSVYQKQFEDRDYQIGHLPPALYILLIRDKNRNIIFRSKLIKQ